MDQRDNSDVAIIGAGPSGAAAASWLARAGYSVRVLERGHFPRFSIGESLLPQCMEHLETCGLMAAAEAGSFQPKNGAAFCRGDEYTAIDFRDKFSPGPGTTWQVERADFDQRLIEGARAAGAEIDFGVTVTEFQADPQQPLLDYINEAGESRSLKARFVLDASGYGRVLARLEKLDKPSSLPTRCALFTHIEDHIESPDHDREKILIGVHPRHADVWYWLIPFLNGRASVGVVASAEVLEAAGADDSERLWTLINEEPRYARLLKQAEAVRDVQRLQGYSADITRLHGPGFAVLGNAGEFLDPVFSSGVTIALDSAVRAAPLVARTLEGESVDWDRDFEIPLRRGVATFREFVDAWYDGRLTRIIFHPAKPTRVRQMIASVLAGYAWDGANPFVAASLRRLNRLAEHCALDTEVTDP
ncbi:FAD-dependent oxidoreductase [Halomonas urmiana]|uniref:FAD-dependent oxidoreductase n=1 Tax=Halomonas urmiana TaxID=490901 RepID=A0A5R8ML16_9GAMM|nr:FAD-dependent oxidoreductase [Halomonas urmiana]TLF51786.1 FAD-dependent oxidoreductase [Halomonas urmiana]